MAIYIDNTGNNVEYYIDLGNNETNNNNEKNNNDVIINSSIFTFDNSNENKNNDLDGSACSAFKQLLLLIKEANISSDEIYRNFGGPINLDIIRNDTDHCNMLLNKIKMYEGLKEKLGSNYKEYLNGNNIYSLSNDLINKINQLIEDNKRKNIEQLKDSIRTICYCVQLGINEDDIKDITPEHFVKGAEGALEDAAKRSNNDSKKTAKLAIDYATALEYDWDCVEDFRKFNSGAQKEDFKTRLKKLKIIKKDAKYITPKELKNGTIAYLKNLKKFIDSQINKKIKETPDYDINQLNEWGNKLYRQTVGKLLINTPEKDKNTIKSAIEAVDSNSFIQNTITGEITAHRIDKSNKTALNNEYYEDLSGTAMGEKIKNAQNTKKAAELMDQFLDRINNLEKEVQKDKYKELLTSISNGINELFNKNKKTINQDTLLLQQYENLISALHRAQERAAEEEAVAEAAGETTSDEARKEAGKSESCAKEENNTIQEKPLRTSLGQALQESMSELQQNNEAAYIDVNRRIGEEITKSDIPEEKKHQIIKFIDKISNGNFSIIMNNPEAKLNPPVKTDNKADGIGIKQQENVDVKASAQAIKDIKQTISEQTQIVNGEKDNKFEVIPDNRVEVKARQEAAHAVSIEEADGSAPSISHILRDIPSIDVSDIREFSISLEPLMKQFSALKSSVQNHIKTRLESRSEEEQVRNIDKMDKNSDKIDLALELNISSDKLKKLHLDTNARKNLELQENIA